MFQNSRAASEESCRLQRRLEDFKLSSAGKKWAQHRQNLPVWGIRQGILDNLADEDVLVVGGDTGCGKTTQVRICVTFMSPRHSQLKAFQWENSVWVTPWPNRQLGGFTQLQA